jgi:hypothetical protein
MPATSARLHIVYRGKDVEDLKQVLLPYRYRITFGTAVPKDVAYVVETLLPPGRHRWAVRLDNAVVEAAKTKKVVTTTEFRVSPYSVYVVDVEVRAKVPAIDDIRIAVAVVCHSKYAGLLNDCLQAVDAQVRLPDQKWLMLDNCELSQQQEYYALANNWLIRKGNWNSPNPGRQLALESTDCPWIWYVDADDVHRPDYLAGAIPLTDDTGVGIIQADRHAPNKIVQTPAHTDYWALRLSNYVDTSALWRVQALKEAGGWKKTERFDDWDCALRMTALGWKTARNPIPSMCTIHSDMSNRNTISTDFPHKWNRSYGVVMLLAGRDDCWEDWSKAVLETSYPANTRFYVVDNSKNKPEFSVKVRKFVYSLSDIGYPATLFTIPDTFEDLNFISKHEHVARLYNKILPRVTEDLTFFWEDDVIPLVKNPLSLLVDHWDCQTVGGICAMYPSREHPSNIMGSPAHDFWHNIPLLSDVRGRTCPNYGFIPGGFALFQTAFVREALPLYPQKPGGNLRGWDGQLSQCIRDHGWKLVLDGKVECEHRTKITK